MDSSVLKSTNLGTEEVLLQEFSLEQQENSKINKTNASAVWSPQFIPFYPKIQEKYSLTIVETVIYGFLKFYTETNQNRFYFTNEQIASIVGCSDKTVARALSTFRKLKLFDMKYKVRAGGGKIRFINPKKDNLSFRTPQNVPFRTPQNVPQIDNKIKENKKHTKRSPNGSVHEYVDKFNSLYSRKYQVTNGRYRKYQARLRTTSHETILLALDNMAAQPFYNGENERGWVPDPDFLIRSDEQVDKFLNMKKKKTLKDLL